MRDFSRPLHGYGNAELIHTRVPGRNGVNDFLVQVPNFLPFHRVGHLHTIGEWLWCRGLPHWTGLDSIHQESESVAISSRVRTSVRPITTTDAYDAQNEARNGSAKETVAQKEVFGECVRARQGATFCINEPTLRQMGTHSPIPT